MTGRIRRVLATLLLGLTLHGAQAAIEVIDDTGVPVRLERPAQRIIALAPHLTELTYAVGAGEQLVGTVAYSDYPPEAEALPRVGGSGGLDLEGILALQPELILAWDSGGVGAQVERLRDIGLPIYTSAPRRVEDIAAGMERIGALSGREAQGLAAARAFRERFAALSERYRGRAPVRVYYQIWDRPLVTLNGEHVVGHLLRLCGASNVFEDLSVLAPQVTHEAVIATDPELILVGDSDDSLERARLQWGRWPTLSAVRHGNIFGVQADVLHRNGPRLLDGMEQLCERVEEGRQRLSR